MSDVSNEPKETKNDPKASGAEDKDFVSKSAYEEVTKDMHKYKSNYKDLMAKVNQLEAEKRSVEETQLAEQNRWKELAERREKEKTDLEHALKRNNEHFIKSVKMSALRDELGNINPKYLVHAELDSIVVHDDGTLSSESVTQVANKFREENPELVPSQNAGTITDNAPSGNTFTKTQPVDLENMSIEDKRKLIASAPRSKNQFRRNNKE